MFVCYNRYFLHARAPIHPHTHPHTHPHIHTDENTKSIKFANYDCFYTEPRVILHFLKGIFCLINNWKFKLPYLFRYFSLPLSSLYILSVMPRFSYIYIDLRRDISNIIFIFPSCASPIKAWSSRLVRRLPPRKFLWRAMKKIRLGLQLNCLRTVPEW